MAKTIKFNLILDNYPVRNIKGMQEHFSVGTAVGGFIGGTIGYMAGSKVAETVVKGGQKIRDKAGETIKLVGSAIVGGVKSFARGVASIFGLM